MIKYCDEKEIKITLYTSGGVLRVELYHDDAEHKNKILNQYNSIPTRSFS